MLISSRITVLLFLFVTSLSVLSLACKLDKAEIVKILGSLHVVPVASGFSSSLLSKANGGIGVSNVLPSERSNRNFPLNKDKKNAFFIAFAYLVGKTGCCLS